MNTKLPQEAPYTMEIENGGPKQGHSLLYRWTGPTGNGPWQNWPPNLDVLNAAFAAGRSVPSEEGFWGRAAARLQQQNKELRDRLARIIAVITPHVDAGGRKMTYTGPDIAERFAALSDEVMAAVPSPVGQEPTFTEAQVGNILKDVCMLALEFELRNGLPGMLIQPGDVMHLATKRGITLP